MKIIYNFLAAKSYAKTAAGDKLLRKADSAY